MQIDKGTFFILVGTIAASGAGGWFARDKLPARLRSSMTLHARVTSDELGPAARTTRR